MWRNNLNLLALLSFLIAFSACAAVTPHQNFINTMNFLVGKNIDKLDQRGFGSKDTISKTNMLENGNIEYQYHLAADHNKCSYILEVDNLTRKIVRWRFDGDSKGCILPP